MSNCCVSAMFKVPDIYSFQWCGYDLSAMLNTQPAATIITALLSLEPNIATSSTVSDLVKSFVSSVYSDDYSYSWRHVRS